MINVKFVGKPRNVQFESRWLEPGEVLEVPEAIADSLITLPHFEPEGGYVGRSEPEPVAETKPDWVEPSEDEDPSEPEQE